MEFKDISQERMNKTVEHYRLTLLALRLEADIEKHKREITMKKVFKVNLGAKYLSKLRRQNRRTSKENDYEFMVYDKSTGTHRDIA